MTTQVFLTRFSCNKNLINQFTKLSTDPTKKTEEKIRRVLRKIKRSLSTQEYSTIYPTGSCPGKFYGTSKVHKLSENGNIDQLPIRPIASNIETPTYQLAKYLAKLLYPLSQSQYTVKRTKDFIGKIQNVNALHGFNMISYDVKSLFSSVPLEETINVTLDRIYHRKEIDTSISKMTCTIYYYCVLKMSTFVLVVTYINNMMV